MSEQDGSGANGAIERGVTKRIVLRRERVIVLPEGVAEEVIARLLGSIDFGPEKRLKAALTKAGPTDGWIVVGEFEGADMTRAIELHAGKPGTPDAIPGVYKAPSVRAWTGGEEYVKPPEPKVERKALVD